MDLKLSLHPGSKTNVAVIFHLLEAFNQKGLSLLALNFRLELNFH